jgi:hypothetical protein
MGAQTRDSTIVRGYFVWAPSTNEIARLNLYERGKKSWYNVLWTYWKPWTVYETRSNSMLSFANVASSAQGSNNFIESIIMEGAVKDFKIHENSFSAPTALEGASWSLESTPFSANKTEYIETYTLDRSSTKSSNRDNETVEQFIRRITETWAAKGYRYNP